MLNKSTKAYLALGILMALTVASAIRSMAQTPTFTLLHSFSGSDGAQPHDALIQASDGNLYGTCAAGGANGQGTIFKSTLSGALTTLYTFSALPWNGSQYVNADGAGPYASLLQASDGNLYGTCHVGGANGQGTLFQITSSGVFTILSSLTGGTGGAEPWAGLIQASDGNLYGTTNYGGLLGGNRPGGQGTLFQITPAGVFTTLYSFSVLDANNHNTDGAFPYQGNLLQAGDGALYGTCAEGGAYGAGTIYKITLSGVLTTLYTFTGGTDGGTPLGGLIQASDRNFYGTCEQGGANGQGTIYKITPSGAFILLHTFSGLTYKKKAYVNTDGATPYARLLQASNGTLYGTTYEGGAYGQGTLFKITPSGIFTLLHAFTGADGSNPWAGLIQATNGNFYGTCSSGGANGQGTLYSLSGG